MIPRNTPAPLVPDAVSLQWANGKPIARAAGSSDRFAPFVGFHIEVGKDAELDTALVGVHQVEIKHQRQGGAEIVRHWSLGERILFLPITSGPPAPTVAACLANGTARKTAEAGIGLRWGQGERSRMAVRGYVQTLWMAGYTRPVQLAVKSRMTDHLLAALLDHTRVATAADGLVDRGKHPAVVSPAELYLPLEAGEEQEFGSSDTATVTPLRSFHPAEIDARYLRTRWRPDALYEVAVAAWPAVQAWAHEYAVSGGDEPEPPAVALEPVVAEEPGLFDAPPARRQSADEAMASGTGGGRRSRRV